MTKEEQEFQKSNNALLLSLTKITSILPEEIKDCKNLEVELDIAKDEYLGLIKQLEDLQNNEESNKLYKLEKIRLEFTRISAKLARFREKENSYSNEKSSWLLDLTSLSFGQIIKMGLAFSLPLMISVIIGAIIIAYVYLITMGF